MFRRIARGVIVAVCLFGFATVAHAAGIPWGQSYASAVAQAKKSRKLIMLDFYADW